MFRGTHSPFFVQRFRRSLQVQDWQRWDRYARRVRILDIDDRRPIVRRKQLEPSMYEEINRTCPRQELLPNLQRFAWWTVNAERQQRSLVFMHPNIKEISMHLYDTPAHPLSAYVDDILARVPHLTKLEVRAVAPMREIESQVLALAHGLPQLKSLVVPMYSITSTAIVELSKVPKLETIEFAHPIEGGTGDRADVAEFAPLLAPGAFPSLKKFSFSAHLRHAVNFISSPSAPKNLTSLYLQVLAIDNPPILHHFFTVVAEQYAQLTELRVDFLLGPDAPIVTPPPPPASRPSLWTIRPILACRRMRKFELRWDYKLSISEADIEELALSWPCLEILLLNCDPIPEADSPMLTPRALLPFARHCLRLRELALYIDGSRVPPTSADPVQPFRALERLAFGSSPVDAVDPMALFLSQLCPVNCEIVAGVRWPDAYGIALDHARVVEHLRAEMSEWWNRWTEVGKVLPLAIKARQDEKGRVVALINEADRRNKCRVEELENELRELRVRMELGP